MEYGAGRSNAAGAIRRWQGAVGEPVIVGLRHHEFGGGRHPAARDRADLVARLTVAAVAMPLALAFGVASRATAAAGHVTAIVAGVVIGALGGAPYQISGPTGAMSAVLLVVAQEHGARGHSVAGPLAATESPAAPIAPTPAPTVADPELKELPLGVVASH